MDIFDTAVLNGIVDSLKRPQTALLDMFFRDVSVAEEEEIKFDMEDGQRRLAPFVSPLKEGKLVESLGYTTKTFKPAYVKDKRVFDPNKPLKRSIGERIGGSLTPQQRIEANLTRETGDQMQMLQRRFEVMASEALRTGKVTVKGDGYPTVVVDFGRNANHTVALSGATAWGASGVKPMDDIEDWALLVLKNSGAVVSDVIMDTDAWRLFRDNVDITNLLDTRRGNPEAVMDTVVAAKLGMQYMGTDGHRRFWVYSDWYVDPDTGTEVPMLPSNTVILASQQVDGVRHFGAIRDEKAGYQAREFFTKSWAIEDPSVRFLLMQSAPLIVPYRPDATFCATVA